MLDLHDNWEEPGDIKMEIENPTKCAIDFGDFDHERNSTRRTLDKEASLTRSIEVGITAKNRALS